MNFIQCARNSNEQNLKLTQLNNNLYFVATRDIAISEELLVWYDEEQYGVYMGLPTGFNDSRGPIIETAAMEPGSYIMSHYVHCLHVAMSPVPLYLCPSVCVLVTNLCAYIVAKRQFCAQVSGYLLC